MASSQLTGTNQSFDLELSAQMQGFELLNKEKLPEIDGWGYIFLHTKTKARLMWLACADQNRSFSIAFKTPPRDDTGVFHIIEHSVLCGSKRYPVKEPFVNLLKTSMKTFLNAMTYPDKTIYPVASTNLKDLKNLMSVYMDAVFAPRMYEQKLILDQEGWHYEFEDEKLIYNGVVFNEMKGALADPDSVLHHALCAELFPDTAYSFESGGHPRSIVKLSYEDFLDHHARHYRPDNSYITLYGDLPIEDFLGEIGSYLESVETRSTEAINPLLEQSPRVAEPTSCQMQTSPEQASCGIAFVLQARESMLKILGVKILLDVLMGSNEAPLKRALLDAELGSDIQDSLITPLLQPMIMLQVIGAKPGALASLSKIVHEVCSDCVKKGLSQERLEASIAQLEFLLREADDGITPSGIVLSQKCLNSWLYDDEAPFSALRYEEELAALKQGIENGFFEQLLDECIVNSKHSAQVELIPTEVGDAEEELAELAAKQAELSQEQVDEINKNAQDLREEQQHVDSPEAAASLPVLKLSDLDAPEIHIPIRDSIGTSELYFHNLSTHGIDYVRLRFDAAHLSFEELSELQLLTACLTQLATDKHDALSLDCAIQHACGSMSFSPAAISLDQDADPELFAKSIEADGAHIRLFVNGSFKCLSSRLDEASSLFEEVIHSTRFKDSKRLGNIVQQMKSSYEQVCALSGHARALQRAMSHLHPLYQIQEQISGRGMYQKLCQILEQGEEGLEALAERLELLAKKIFSSPWEASFVGSEEDLNAWKTRGFNPGDVGSSPRQMQLPKLERCHEATYVAAGGVCFVGAAFKCLDTRELAGASQVACRALNLDLLWNEVRVKGGAYGVGIQQDMDGYTRLFSYRDPAVDPTIERFGLCSSWLKNFEPTTSELEGYIISSVAGLDTPLKPAYESAKMDGLRLKGLPYDFNQQLREKILATSRADLACYADALAAAQNSAVFSVYGTKSTIDASSLEFGEITSVGTIGNSV